MRGVPSGRLRRGSPVRTTAHVSIPHTCGERQEWVHVPGLTENLALLNTITLGVFFCFQCIYNRVETDNPP